MDRVGAQASGGGFRVLGIGFGDGLVENPTQNNMDMDFNGLAELAPSVKVTVASRGLCRQLGRKGCKASATLTDDKFCAHLSRTTF